MKSYTDCEYLDKLQSGEVLMQAIKAQVVNYLCDTIHETVDYYSDIIELMHHDPESLKCFTRTVGYIAGTLNKDGKICIRGSFCIPNDFNMFNANHGKNAAIAKLYMDSSKHMFLSEHSHNLDEDIIHGEGIVYVMPYTLRAVYDYFSKRCESYFKGHTIDVGSKNLLNLI